MDGAFDKVLSKSPLLDADSAASRDAATTTATATGDATFTPGAVDRGHTAVPREPVADSSFQPPNATPQSSATTTTSNRHGVDGIPSSMPPPFRRGVAQTIGADTLRDASNGENVVTDDGAARAFPGRRDDVNPLASTVVDEDAAIK